LCFTQLAPISDCRLACRRVPEASIPQDVFEALLKGNRSGSYEISKY
jgi:hypothetical protein